VYYFKIHQTTKSYYLGKSTKARIKILLFIY